VHDPVRHRARDGHGRRHRRAERRQRLVHPPVTALEVTTTDAAGNTGTSPVRFRHLRSVLLRDADAMTDELRSSR
jgi:hypothetical protein